VFLYRPRGLEELRLMYQADIRAFPLRLGFAVLGRYLVLGSVPHRMRAQMRS
jgi:hypothetical protein